MTFSKLLLAMSLLCAGVAQGAVTFTAEQIAAFEQEYVPEHVSPENEAFIRPIMHELDFTWNIILKKSTPQMIEIAPVYMFEHYYAEVNMWIINEAWFNTLTPAERRYVVGFRLMAMTKTAHDMSRAEKAFTYASYAAGTAELLLAAGLGYAVYSYSRSKMKALIAAIVFSLGVEYFTDPLFASMKSRKVLQVLYAADDYIVQKLDCLDGALAVLKQKRDIIEPLYNKDKAYWKGAYESLAPRIAHLEILKLAQNV